MRNQTGSTRHSSSLEVEGEVELNSSEFNEWYEFTLAEGGEPLSDGEVSIWPGEDGRISTGFEETIEPGDTIYINYNNGSPQIYVNEIPKKGTLRRGEPNHIVISSGSGSIAIDAHYTPDSE